MSDYVEQDPFYLMGPAKEARHCVGNVLVRSVLFSCAVIPVSTAIGVAGTYAHHMAMAADVPYVWTDVLPPAIGIGYGASVAMAGIMTPEKYSRNAKTIGLLSAIGINFASTFASTHYDSIDLFKNTDKHHAVVEGTQPVKSAFDETAEEAVSKTPKATAWPENNALPRNIF